MSSPAYAYCCGENYLMFDRTFNCPECGTGYISHRATQEEKRECLKVERAFKKEKKIVR